MNYDSSKISATFLYKEILAHLQILTPTCVTFQEYVAGYYGHNVFTKASGMPVQYYYSLDFLKKHADRCVSFVFSDGESIAKGAAPLSAIYQISPTLHVWASISYWNENDVMDGHVTAYCLFEHFDEALAFVADNQDVIKENPRTKNIMGFSLKAQN